MTSHPRPATLLLCLLWTGACSGADQASDAATDSLPPAEPARLSWPGTFGFANSAGSELLALAPDSTTPEHRWAICAGARRSAVARVRTQQESPASSHRQTARNFANEAGDVYAGPDASFTPDRTCFLTPDSGLA